MSMDWLLVLKIWNVEGVCLKNVVNRWVGLLMLLSRVLRVGMLVMCIYLDCYLVMSVCCLDLIVYCFFVCCFGFVLMVMGCGWYEWEFV